jgi:hypothetical protein
MYENSHPPNRCYVKAQGEVVFPSTQHYYRRFLLFIIQLTAIFFRPYDHLQVEIYLLEITLLTTL